MKIVGLCGGSGSGKGSVSAILSDLGYSVINTDDIYHYLVSHDTDCLRDIRREFGDDVINGGALDRRKLSAIVFSGIDAKERLKTLNQITHHHVLCEVRDLTSKLYAEGKKIVFVDVPLLFESGFNNECDVTVSVLADKEIRINRICDRDGLDRTSANRRIASQIPDDILKNRTDYSILNNGSLSELNAQVKELIKIIDK